MPMGIKDIIETADMPTEMGSPLFAGWRSEKDAACVSALRQAGAVILGKTVTTEFAATEPRGTRNPWNLEHTPGGSSSGSAAAVGCGMVSAGARHAGDRLDHPAGELSAAPTASSRRSNALNREGCHDYQSQSCTGIIAATLEDTWQVAHEIVSARRRRRRHAGPGRPRHLPCPGEAEAARVPRNRRLGERRAGGARRCMQEALAAAEERRHRDRDAPRRRRRSPRSRTSIVGAHPLSNKINSFETRWFLRGARDRDAEQAQQGHADAPRGERGADA